MAARKPSLTDVGLLIARIAGAGIAVHGWGKVSAAVGPGEWHFVDDVRALGFPQPLIFAWAAALSEFVGGLAVLLGVYTRVAAFFAATTVFVAAFLKHAGDSLETKERALLYLVLFLGLVFAGGGRLTIDKTWRKG